MLCGTQPGDHTDDRRAHVAAVIEDIERKPQLAFPDRDSLVTGVAEQRLSLRDAIDGLAAATVALDPDILVNVNTPDDVQL